MEQQQKVETEIQNEKEEEEMVSPSPDSGCVSGRSSIQSVKEPASSKPLQCSSAPSWENNTLYPFYYKYPDNKKLTLLKSLSQDSEYSLDTSLFDAEDFLQEMGFAGSCGPTIPDRFLPSLLQRLSKFPESEMESLNDRIIQSIGCFRRKEGKRRLFRNLSMGKSANSDQMDNLPISNSYPLLRSNTGPASFSFNSMNSSSDSNKTPSSNKLNSSNNSSFAEEDEFFPESPIAILVSSASVDTEHEETFPPNVFDEELFKKIDNYKSDDEKESDSQTTITNNDEENILEEKTSELEEPTREDSNEQKVIAKASTENDEILDQSISDTVIISDDTQQIDIKSEDNEVSFLGDCDEKEEMFASTNISPMTTTVDSHVIKQPLRRLSQGNNFFSLNSSEFCSTVNQNKIDTRDSIFSNLTELENNDSLLSFEFHATNTVTEASSLDFSDSFSLESEKEALDSINDYNYGNDTKNETAIVNTKMNDCGKEKPKYTRDNSLTNFLSSMLVTNDETLSENSSIRTSQTFLSDYPTTKSIASETISSSNSSAFNENCLKFSQTSSDMNCADVNQPLKLENKQPKEKIPNRKRRVLRRMSSSLNYGDDENVDEDFKSINGNDLSSPENISPSSFKPSKPPIQSPIPGPCAINCPITYPCCCLPQPRECFRSCCDEFTCMIPNNIERKNYKRSKSTSLNRKTRINCARNRYFSCPSSSINAYCDSYFPHKPLSSSMQNLQSSSHIHPCYHSACFRDHNHNHSHSSMCSSNSWSNCCAQHSLDSHNSEHHNKFTPFLKQNFQGNQNFFQPKLFHPSNLKNNSSSQTKWNSTPDVRLDFQMSSSFNKRRQNIDYNSSEAISSRDSSLSSTSKEYISFDDVFINETDPDTNPSLKVFSNDISELKHSDFQYISSKSKNDVSTRNLREQSLCAFNANSSVPKERNRKPMYRQATEQLTDKTNYSRNLPLSLSNSYPLQNNANHYDLTPIRQTMRKSSIDDTLSSFGEHPNNNSEALLEKKIRVFSKFLTNLGDLTKSVSDPNLDNNYNSTIESQCHDSIRSDKQSSAHLYDKSDKLFSDTDKCKTTSPEFDKLMKFLNLMELRKSSCKNEKNSFEKHSDCAGSESYINKLPVYENSVFLGMKKNDHGQQAVFVPESYTSSISLHINGNDIGSNNRDAHDLQLSYSNENIPVLSRNSNIRMHSLQMPFKEVSKELEELQLSIQKAKEMRISASKELHMLQELLSGDNLEENELRKGKKNTNENYQKENCIRVSEKSNFEALSDLRQKSVSSDSDDTAFWQEEMKKMKKENDEEWRTKLKRMEKRLLSQEEELHKLHDENENLHKQLDMQNSAQPTKPDVVQNGVGRTDSAFEDDEEYMIHKSSIPIESSRQECERLQEQLVETEQRADQLNLLLNQKLIELNKLQLTLSKQTKEMIELEKSYLQLQHRVRKGTSKPMVAKLCSRTSPFNSKNLCPKPSPPASPQPNGV